MAEIVSAYFSLFLAFIFFVVLDHFLRGDVVARRKADAAHSQTFADAGHACRRLNELNASAADPSRFGRHTGEQHGASQQRREDNDFTHRIAPNLLNAATTPSERQNIKRNTVP